MGKRSSTKTPRLLAAWLFTALSISGCQAQNGDCRVDFAQFQEGQRGVQDVGCGVTATAFYANNPTRARRPGIIDTSLPPNGQADLGAPNEDCANDSGNGPGVGTGGRPGRPFSNCEPQGMALVVPQRRGRQRDIFSRNQGGTLRFDFGVETGGSHPTVEAFGLLDNDEGATLRITTADGETTTRNIRRRASNHFRHVDVAVENVVTMELELGGSAAVTYLDTSCSSCIPSVCTGGEIDPYPEVLDWIVVGAGMSGLAAAKHIEHLNERLGFEFTYQVFEAEDRPGGRLRSFNRTFGSQNILLNEGADWIQGYQQLQSLDNPVYHMALNQSMTFTQFDTVDWDTYEETSPGVFDPTSNTLVRAYVIFLLDTLRPCLDDKGILFDQTRRRDQAALDDGVIAAMMDCGWNADNALQEAVQRVFIDLFLGTNDTSIGSFPRWNEIYFGSELLYVNDPRGYAQVPEWVADTLQRPNAVMYNHEVILIDWGGPPTSTNYVEGTRFAGQGFSGADAMVLIKDRTTGACQRYYSRMVQSALPHAVLVEQADTLFLPPLNTRWNNYESQQLVKIAIEFSEKFWADTEIIMLTKEKVDNNLLFWQNMDLAGFYPGSKTLMGRITTQGMIGLTGSATGVLALDIVEEQLLPDLYSAYNVDSSSIQIVDFIVSGWGQSQYAGYASHSTRRIGQDSHRRFYEQTYGLGNRRVNWSVLHLGGAISCKSLGELSHAAYFSGIRNIMYALEERGVDLNDLGPASNNICDTFELVGPI